MEEKIAIENTEGREDIAFEESEYQVLAESPLFELEKRDAVFAVIFSLASIIMSAFGFWGGFRAGYSVASLLMLGIVTVYLGFKKVKHSCFSVMCLILAAVISPIFAITSNGSVRFFGFLVLFLLSLVWFASFGNILPEKGDLGLLVTIFKPVFCLAFPNIPTTVKSLFSGDGGKRKSFLRVISGVVLAMPVLLVVVPLLMSSDAAFNGLAQRLVGDLFLTVIKIIVGLVLALFVTAYCFSLKKRELPQSKESNFNGFDNTVIVSFLSVLAVCYLTYLFSQLAYFFSAFSGFLPDDYSFTPAEYARRGFFEMSIIAAINLFIIFTALLVSRKNEGKICIASRILCTFIGVFTLIIIATAISKMVLYINRFGMTVLRITTSSFMLFLAVVFISLMLRIFLPRIKVLRTALITAGVVLAILGIVNVNNVVAEYNYNAYKNGVLTDIDVYTIYELGEEGIPYLVKLANDDNNEVSQNARNRLGQAVRNGSYYKLEYKYEPEGKVYTIKGKRYEDIGKFSFSRKNAYNALDGFIKENPDILIEK